MARSTVRHLLALVTAAGLVLTACGGQAAAPSAVPEETHAQPMTADEVPAEDMRTIRDIIDERIAEATAELGSVPTGPDGCPPGFVEDTSAYSEPLRDLDEALREAQRQAPPGLLPDMSDLQELLGESLETYDEMAGMGVCVPETPGEQPELTDEEVLEQFCEMLRESSDRLPEGDARYEVAHPQAICGVRG